MIGVEVPGPRVEPVWVVHPHARTAVRVADDGQPALLTRDPAVQLDSHRDPIAAIVEFQIESATCCQRLDLHLGEVADRQVKALTGVGCEPDEMPVAQVSETALARCAALSADRLLASRCWRRR